MYLTGLSIREFGSLRDLSLDFGNRINLIEGDNESGKSTVLAFIRFMFYGFPKKPAGEVLSESERYGSWENGIADGNLTLVKNGIPYRIERRERLYESGSTRRTLQIINLTTGLPEKKGTSPAQFFLGFPEQVFDSTCCVRQWKVGAVHANGLSETVENLLLSGDETVSTEKALKKLNEVRRSLFYERGKGGAIADCDGEIFALEERLRRAKTEQESRRAVEKRAGKLKEMSETFEAQYAKADRICRAAEARDLCKRFDELHRKEQEVANAAEALDAIKKTQIRNGQLPSARYIDDLTASAARLEQAERNLIQASADLRVAESKVPESGDTCRFAESIRESGGADVLSEHLSSLLSKARRAKRIGLLSVLAGGLLGLLGILLAVFLQNPAFLFFLFGILPALPGLLFLQKWRLLNENAEQLLCSYGYPVRIGKNPDPTLPEQFRAFLVHCLKESDRRRDAEEEAFKQKRRTDAAEQEKQAAYRSASACLAELLSDPYPPTPARMNETANRLRKELAEREKAEFAFRKQAEACEKDRAALREYDEDALRALSGSEELPSGTPSQRLCEERDRIARSIRENEAERLSVEKELTRLESTAENPARVAALLSGKQEERAALQARYDAVRLALDALESAKTGLKSRLTPRLTEDSAKYFSYLTGQSDRSLALGPDFAISCSEAGQVRPSAAFSGGTQDAMYLSLRLAFSSLLSKEEPLPLFFDEAFSQLDDSRTAAFLALLTEEELLPSRQVFLFTCQKREGELLSSRADKVSKIRLSCDPRSGRLP